MSNQIAEDIRQGVAYLDAHGWCQHVHTDELTGQVCIYGGIDNGIRIAEGFNGPSWTWGEKSELFNRSQRAKRFVDSVVAEKYPSFSSSRLPAADWNDNSKRTVEEVRALMLAAAEKAEAEGAAAEANARELVGV